MKKFAVSSMSLVVFAFAIVAVGSVCVLGQEPEPLVCVVEKRDCEKEVRRVPLASFFRDETGSVVYTINGNESWRRTEIEVKRGQKIEISASGVVRWAQDGIEKIQVTPDGARPPYRDGWNYYHFPFPEAGIGSLVMRIGKGVYPAVLRL